jgi:hypothetical protein
MTKTFTRFIFLLSLSAFVPNLHAQTLQTTVVNLINDLNPSAPITFNNSSGLGKMSSCGVDTVYYPWYKTTAFNAVALNNVTSGNTFTQWYDAMQAVTVSGFSFYGWQSSGSPGIVSVNCCIYNAGPDSMPFGAPLACTPINIDTVFGGGVLSSLHHQAVFANAVTVSNPYVLTVESASNTNVSIISNNWNTTATTQPNGRNEWLSSVKIGNTFSRGYNINVGGVIFDADFIFQPYVTFDFDADFSISACNSINNTITFTNNSSDIFFSKYYNRYAFSNIAYIGCQWTYGDSSGNFISLNGTRQYRYAVPYTVTLKDTLYGWRIGCVDVESKVVGTTPGAPVISSNSPLCGGADLHLHADSIPFATYYWTGPNGFTSTDRNPTIPNAGVVATGTYSAVAIISGCSSVASTVNVNIINALYATSNAPLCEGQRLNLNINQISGATYAWTGPNGFSASTANPFIGAVSLTDTGTYSVTVNVNGCGTLGPFTVYVRVNQVPAQPVVASNSPICTGDTVKFSSSFVQGVYNWYGPNNFYSQNQNPIRANAQPSYAGTYMVSVTANGCTSPTSSVLIGVSPVPQTPNVSNNGPLCNGQTLQLTSSNVSNATYEWTGPSSFTSSIQNPSINNITVSDSGTYALRVLVNGCYSNIASTRVAISTNTPSPTISNNGPLCPAQQLELSASLINGATYSWTGPNGFSSSDQNPIITSVTEADSGDYTVVVNTTACGNSTPVSTKVIVSPLPNAPQISTNSPLCVGGTINLSASTIPNASYTWSGPNGFSSTNQNPNIINATINHTGEYSVYVTVNGCGNSATSTSFVKVHKIPSKPIITGLTAVCLGDSLQLSGNSSDVSTAATYTWTGPNSFSSTEKNPVFYNVNSNNGGTYSLTVTDSNCTSQTTTSNITIKPIPDAPEAGNTGPVCAGAALNLTASLMAGATYEWSGVNGYSAQVRNPAIFNPQPSSSGTYQVVAIVNGCKSSPASTSVVVNAIPDKPVVSDSIMKCENESVQLSAQSSNNVNYSWSGPSGFTSNQQNPLIGKVGKAQAGLYQVIATSANCASLPSYTRVIVNSAPAALILTSNPQVGQICTGDSLQLYASLVEDGVYEWKGPNGFTSSLQRPLLRNLNSSNSGIYTAKVTRYGCVSPEATMNVEVSPVPNTSEIVGPEMIYVRDTQTYYVTGAPNSIYNWTVSSGGLFSSPTSNDSVDVRWMITGNDAWIKVIEITQIGCKGPEKTLNLNVVRVGLNKIDFKNGHISLYPNPASQHTTLRFDVIKSGEAKITFANVLGQIVLSDNKFISQKDELTYQLNQFKTGIYIVTIEMNGETKNFKLLID